MTEPTSPSQTPEGAPMSRVRFHHMRQQPVTGLNQMFRVYRPFPGPGIGIVLFRHEFSITVGPEEHP